MKGLIRTKENTFLEFDFNYTNIVAEYEDEIIEQYLHAKKDNPQLNDLSIPEEHPLRDMLVPQVEAIIEENFFVGKKVSNMKMRLGVYIQNNEMGTYALHDHSHTEGNIAAIFYYNLPKEGGEFYYSYLGGEGHGFSNKIKTEENKLYLMPMWLPHKPCPQKDTKYRMCFSYAYPSNERPIHKITKLRW